MNKKGFTLIELLAVIVVLGLVLIISVPNLTDVYKNSKLKTEEIFIDKLSKKIEEYIDFNKDTWSFKKEPDPKTKKVPNSKSTEVTVWRKDKDISFQELLNSKLVTKGDFIDPNTKKNCSEGNSTNRTIEVYKDTDYVYCFVVRKKSFNIIEETSCLSDDYLNKYTKGDEIINTCPWD